MARVIEYFFSPVSPWAYLGARRFFEIADRARAEVLIKPCDFNQIFAASGGVPVGQRPKQRQAYRLAELARWRAQIGTVLQTVQAQRVIPVHPIAQRLPVHPRTARRLRPAPALQHQSQRQRAPSYRAAITPRRRLPEISR